MRRLIVNAPCASSFRLPLCPLDGLLGSQKNIEASFVFTASLDPDAVAHSLHGLLTHFPALAGRLSRVSAPAGSSPLVGWQLSPAPSGVVLECTSVETDLQFAVRESDPAGRYIGAPPTPHQLMAGRAAPLHCRLTQLAGGGSVLAVSLNHAAADATGLHAIMRAWSAVHCGTEVDPALHMQRTDLTAAASAPAGALQLDDALDLNSFKGRALWWLARHSAARPTRPRRARISLPRPHTSTMPVHAALCGSIANELFSRMRETRSVATVLDMRGLLGLSAGFVGNALHLSHSGAAPEECCMRQLQQMAKRRSHQPEQIVQQWRQLQQQLAAARVSAGDCTTPLVVNFQSRIPMLDLSFGVPDSCVRCIPGAGDTVKVQMKGHWLIVLVIQVHVVPADEGNLDVYINLETVAAYSPQLVSTIESRQFRDQIIESINCN